MCVCVTVSFMFIDVVDVYLGVVPAVCIVIEVILNGFVN